MEYINAKIILSKCKSTDWFGTDYNMNIYRGCCHGCIYCDSRSQCYGIDDFERVRAKKDALVILRDELKRKVRTGVVGTGSMSDPYNPFENELMLTRHSFELLDAFGFGLSVITKSWLITRDADIIKDISEHSPVICKLTVTAADDSLCQRLEPDVSVSSERFRAMETLSNKGIFTGTVMMPVLPFIEDNEENITAIVRQTAQSGGRFVYPAFGVTLRQNQRQYFLDKLDQLFPDKKLSHRYVRSFGNRYECVSPDAGRLWEVFKSECSRYGLLYNMKDIVSAYKTGYESSQLSFF